MGKERDQMNPSVAEREVEYRLGQDDRRMQEELHGELDHWVDDPADTWGVPGAALGDTGPGRLPIDEGEQAFRLVRGAGPGDEFSGERQMPVVDTPPQELYDQEMIAFSIGLASDEPPRRGKEPFRSGVKRRT